MNQDKPLGWEHEEDYKDGFHDRLSQFWPEERDQLHSGGVKETKRMITALGFDKNPGVKVLDLCCGEGATAIYLARHYNITVVGVDIVNLAIEAAQKKAKENNLQDKAIFQQGNVFDLKFPDNEFDFVIGQDPDAFSHPQRLVIFKQIFRVLKPGGKIYFHHHWIPGFDWSHDDLKDMEDYNQSIGCKALEDCCAESYVRDISGAGFRILVKDDITELAAAHLRGVAIKHLERNHEIKDKWLKNLLRYIDLGNKFGVRIIAQKPRLFDLNVAAAVGGVVASLLALTLFLNNKRR